MTYPAIFGLFVAIFVFLRCLSCSTPIDHWPRFVRTIVRLAAAVAVVATLVGVSLSVTEAYYALRPAGLNIIRFLKQSPSLSAPADSFFISRAALMPT